MKIRLICIGESEKDYLLQGIELYKKKLKHYVPFELIELSTSRLNKNLAAEEVKVKEGQMLLDYLKDSGKFFLLDEKGKSYTSVKFANFLQKEMNSGIKTLTFVIGGPFGFSTEVYEKSSGKVCLSSMT